MIVELTPSDQDMHNSRAESLQSKKQKTLSSMDSLMSLQTDKAILSKDMVHSDSSVLLCGQGINMSAQSPRVSLVRNRSALSSDSASRAKLSGCQNVWKMMKSGILKALPYSTLSFPAFFNVHSFVTPSCYCPYKPFLKTAPPLGYLKDNQILTSHTLVTSYTSQYMSILISCL